MQESGAKRPAKLPQRESTEENDRADTLSDACQDGEADGDVPAHQSKMTKSAEAPEATQEAPLHINMQHAATAYSIQYMYISTPEQSRIGAGVCYPYRPRAQNGGQVKSKLHVTQ